MTNLSAPTKRAVISGRVGTSGASGFIDGLRLVGGCGIFLLRISDWPVDAVYSYRGDARSGVGCVVHNVERSRIRFNF
eukprot:249065-Prorocentrum_minimum.AAC.2